MPDKKKEVNPNAKKLSVKNGDLHKWLGKTRGENITDADIEKGLKAKEAHIRQLAKHARDAKVARHGGKKIAKESITDLNSLRIETSRVSLESFSGADVKQLLTNTFPSIVSNVKEFFAGFTPANANNPAIILSFNEAAFIKEVSTHSYLDIAPLAAFVPEGLDVTYSKYSEELMPAVAHASKILSGVMTSYSTFLSQLISNSDLKLSTQSFEKIYTELTKEREKLNVEIGKCFKRGSTKAEVTIGDVVDRNADWHNVINSADVMLKLINGVDRKALNKKINECSDLLDVILAKMNRNEFEGMSPEIIRNLSDGAYQVASELEFYSVTFYKVMAYSASISNTVEHFENVFEK